MVRTNKQEKKFLNGKQRQNKRWNFTGDSLFSKSVCDSLSMSSNACFEGFSGPQTVLLNDLTSFIVYCSNTCLFVLLVS